MKSRNLSIFALIVFIVNPMAYSSEGVGSNEEPVKCDKVFSSAIEELRILRLQYLAEVRSNRGEVEDLPIRIVSESEYSGLAMAYKKWRQIYMDYQLRKEQVQKDFEEGQINVEDYLEFQRNFEYTENQYFGAYEGLLQVDLELNEEDQALIEQLIQEIENKSDSRR